MNLQRNVQCSNHKILGKPGEDNVKEIERRLFQWSDIEDDSFV